MPTRILVCLDGSEIAEGALPFALACARNAGEECELVLAQVPEPLPSIANFRPKSFEELAESLQIQVAGYLEAIAAELRTRGFRATCRTPAGSIQEALIRLAEAENVDLIIAASHGRSGVRRWMLGSVAERLVRHAPAPLLLIPHRAMSETPWQKAEIPALRRALLALDGSSLSEAIVQFPSVVPIRPEHVHLVQATDVPDFLGRQLLERDPGMREYIAQLDGYLAGLAAGPELRDYQVTWKVADMLAPEAVLSEAQEVGADFIALMTAGRGGVIRFLIGSVAEKIARASTCPVLLLNPHCVRENTDATSQGEAAQS